MQYGHGCLLAFFAVVVFVAAGEGFRRDRLLGWILSAAAVVYVAAALLMGVYLREVRGRDYLAPDEVGYQQEGEQIARSWRTGETHVPIVAGGYPTWNAVIIFFWGPSPVPMRLANAVAGVLGVLFAYILAWQLFRDRLSARLAALFVALSPSLIVWGSLNLKERPLGMLVSVALVAGLALLERWTLSRVGLFAAAILLLGELRHYYAAIIGWIVLGVVAVWPEFSWRDRFLRAGTLALAVGLVLQVVTGTFLASGMRGETIMRYVRLPSASVPGHTSSAEGVRARGAAGEAVTAEGRSVAPAASDLRTGFHMGETSGAAVSAGRRTAGEWARAAAFVLFGRFEPLGPVGRVYAAALAPEWVMTFVLLPLACVAVGAAVRHRRWPVVVPAGFVGAMLLLLSYVHADPWSTIRFRAVYWPVLLVLSAGGTVSVLRAVQPQQRSAVVRAHE